MIYKLLNKKTKEVKEVILSVKEKEKFLKENPDWVNVIDSPSAIHFKGSGWQSKNK